MSEGKSVREVAHALNISHGLVMQIERSAVMKIAKALGLPAPYELARNKRGRSYWRLKR